MVTWDYIIGMGPCVPACHFLPSGPPITNPRLICCDTCYYPMTRIINTSKSLWPLHSWWRAMVDDDICLLIRSNTQLTALCSHPIPSYLGCSRDWEGGRVSLIQYLEDAAAFPLWNTLYLFILYSIRNYMTLRILPASKAWLRLILNWNRWNRWQKDDYRIKLTYGTVLSMAFDWDFHVLDLVTVAESIIHGKS